MTSATSASSGSQSTVEQVKGQVQDVAQQAKGQTREQLRSQIDERSTQVGDQLASAAQAMRRTSDQMRQEGNEKAAEIVESLVSRGERAGDYLRNANGDTLLHDIENFGRRQPWVMVGGSAVVGFLASRFLKASSSSRYQGGYPSRLSGGGSGSGAGSSAAVAPPSTVPALAAPGPDGRREGGLGAAGGVAGGLD